MWPRYPGCTPNSPLFRTLIDSGSLLEGSDTLVLTGIATDVIATGAALARRLGVLPTPAWERSREIRWLDTSQAPIVLDMVDADILAYYSRGPGT
jgi:hypothetical protein